MDKTNWRDIAELVGIMAIVASLIAVAFQLHQTHAALVASTYQSRAFDAIAEAQYVADSDHLLSVLVKTQSGADNKAIALLNDSERLRLRHFLLARMIDWDNEYYQSQNGFLDEDFFETTTKRHIRIWAPRWRAAGLKEGRQDFREYVDSLLKDERSE